MPRDKEDEGGDISRCPDNTGKLCSIRSRSSVPQISDAMVFVVRREAEEEYPRLPSSPSLSTVVALEKPTVLIFSRFKLDIFLFAGVFFVSPAHPDDDDDDAVPSRLPRRSMQPARMQAPRLGRYSSCTGHEGRDVGEVGGRCAQHIGYFSSMRDLNDERGAK